MGEIPDLDPGTARHGEEIVSGSLSGSPGKVAGVSGAAELQSKSLGGQRGAPAGDHRAGRQLGRGEPGTVEGGGPDAGTAQVSADERGLVENRAREVRP